MVAHTQLMATAWWLAKRNIRTDWLSFVLSGLYMSFMGAVIFGSISIGTEFAHALVMLMLYQSFISTRYMTLKLDNPVVQQQIFYRNGPAALAVPVTARVMAMLVSGAINIPAYFIWAWILEFSGHSFIVFLAWVLFWSSIALFGLALQLIQEFWLNVRRWSVASTVIIAVMFIAIPLILWQLDASLIIGSFRLVERHPVLAPFCSLIFGVATVVGGWRVAMLCWRRREFIT